MTDDQKEVIAFLEQPGSYPHRPETVERIDTHGAVIFLAGERVYKLKRAVKLSYLDFSTLGKREAVCRREIELNKPAAPSLYRDVVAVTRASDGALRLGGEGPAVEWLIEMSRFGQEQLFDRLAVAGRLDGALIDALADLVISAHAGAPAVPDAPWPDSLHGVIGTLDDMLERWKQLSGRDHSAYFAALENTFARRRALLEERREAGFVRRCHADLHLKNIVLIDGRPCLFDALEFDENLARIDVLYDLGFLIMDLWHRGLRDEANRLLNRYVAREMPEAAWRGLAVLPLFLSIRAAIRAMVAVDALAVAEGKRSAELRDDIAGYIELAEALAAPPAPRLIAIGGLSGSGKSTAALAVAPEIGAAPGAIVLRTDLERKLMRDMDATERLGATAYSPEARSEVYLRLFAKAKLILAAGHSVIIDAVFDEPALREAARATAAESDVPFVGIWLDAPKEVLIARVTARSGDASDADAGVVLRQIETVSAPTDWQTADASGPPTQTADRLRELL